MTIPYALIPTFKILLRALITKLPKDLFWPKNFESGSITLYSRGALALRAALEKIIAENKKNQAQIWLPDYFCNEPAQFLESIGFRLYFYPIKKDLSPDWEKIKFALTDISRPDAFVLVHYFGFVQEKKIAQDFCKQNNAVLIEDCAHLIPSNPRSENYSIYSPRKFFPIPDGGLLVEPGPSHQAICYQENVFASLRWLSLRLVQKTMLFLNIPWHKFKSIAHKKKSPPSCPINDKDNGAPSLMSLKLLSTLENDLEKIIRKRRENYLRMRQAVSWNEKIKPLFANLPDHVCPFMFPIIIGEGSDVLIKKLQHSGIPASSWPDLPSTVLNNPTDHEDALWLKKNILLLPIHQNLKEKHLCYIIDCLNKAYDERY